MAVYFTSDLHLGHRNIHKYRTRFNSTEENDKYMLDLICSLDKRDILIVLGDFLFDGEHFNDYLNHIETKAKCRIKLIMGNHDSKLLYNLPTTSRISIELPLYSYKNMWLSHCPIHPKEMRGRLGNIHGHLHEEHVTYKNANMFSSTFAKPLLDPRYFNVNIDVNNYQFVKLDTIKEYFNAK